MTTFKVGDRVRVVRDDDLATGLSLVGREAVITDVGSFVGWGGTDHCKKYKYEIRVDGLTEIFVANCAELEPLIRPPLLSVEEEIKRLFERTDLVEGPAREKAPMERLHDKIESAMGWRPR